MVAVVAAIVAISILRNRGPEITGENIRQWPLADLPRHLYATGESGTRVSVAFPHDLKPTADPLVWRFSPGTPPHPDNYEIRYVREPKFGRAPHVVEGVASFRADGIRRIKGVPGLVVMDGACLRGSP